MGKVVERFSRSVCGRFRRPLLLCFFATVFFLFAHIAVQAIAADGKTDFHALWAASESGITKSDLHDTSIKLVIPDTANVSRIAIDDRSLVVWAAGNGSIGRFDFSGAQLSVTPLIAKENEKKSGDEDENEAGNDKNLVLAVNKQDGAAWIGFGKRLIRFNADGSRAGSVKLSDKILSISFDETGGGAWIAGSRAVGYYGAGGVLEKTLPLGKVPKVRALAFDNVLGRLWIARHERIEIYADGALAAKTEFDADGEAGLYADLSGGVWVVAKERLYHFDQSGTLVFKSPKKAVGHIRAFTVDPLDHSVWVADKKNLYHLDSAGAVLKAAELTDQVNDLAVFADTIAPVVNITAPAGGSYTNNASPVISLSYSDAGSGVDTAGIAVAADGVALSVSCTATETRADCTPAATLADGVHTLAATVKDLAGNVSKEASVTFTIDTIVPVVTISSPKTSAVTNNPLVTVSGTASEPATLTLTHRSPSGAAAVPLTPDAANGFSYGPLTMGEGLNEFTVGAVDRAGNRAQVSAIVTLDTVAPTPVPAFSVSVSQPVGGIVQLLGFPGAAEAGATIGIINAATGISAVAPVNPDGGFGAVINASWWDTLVISVTDAAGNVSASMSVVVVMPPPSAPLNPSAAASDGSVTLTWDAVALSDTYNVYYGTSPTVTIADTKVAGLQSPATINGLTNGTTYYFAVSGQNSGGEGVLSATASATPLPPPPTAPGGVAATASDGQIVVEWQPVAGASAYNIYWSNTPGVSTLSNKIAGVASPYAHTGLTNGTAYYYAVSAENIGGESPLSAEVSAIPVQAGPRLPPDPSTIAPPIDMTVPTDMADSTAFLYTGANAIQTGVAPGTIEARRVAIIRGKVMKRDGAALPGVTITIKDHPEFGGTLSRADGMFDMAVNGGGDLVVQYAMAGYLPAQRSVATPWKDWVYADDVALVQLDPQVTTVDLANATTIQVAQGSVQTDADGTRQATLLFAPGTTATMVMPDGATQPLTTLNVRATEYTVGANGKQAMPATLPATTGYTYAVELTVDEALSAGAKSIEFNQPVYAYVDNFLGFQAGAVIPSGWFDASKNAWIASENGYVVSVLSIDSAGKAVLDLFGSGQPATAAQLAVFGFTDAELVKIASRFGAGKSFWRIPVNHFSTWDWNTPIVCKKDPVTGQPCTSDSAGAPPPETVPEVPCPGQKPGSIIQCENRSLGEKLDIAGTPLSVYYNSFRTEGNTSAYQVKIPVTDSRPIHPSLKWIEIRVSVGGKTFISSITAVSNQTYTFLWDGKDIFGRPMQGRIPVGIGIAYHYHAQLAAPVLSAQGGKASSQWAIVDNPSNFVKARSELTFAKSYGVEIGVFKDDPKDLGGWSISAHHRYSSDSATLYKGDGTFQGVNAINWMYVLAAGNSSSGALPDIASIDGKDATSIALQFPRGLAVAADGSYYFVHATNMIVKVDANGIAHVVGGGNGIGYGGDGGPARQALFGEIPSFYTSTLALGPDGSLFVAEKYRIRRIAPDGTVSTVAGTGAYNTNIGPTGDNGLATAATVAPTALTVDSEGGVYFVDWWGHIRQINPKGIIRRHPVAGVSGTFRNGLAMNRATGDLYATDLALHVWRIGPSGNGIYAGAGCKQFNTHCIGTFGGDGDLATLAYLNSPTSLALGGDGTLYINDQSNYRVRAVSVDGFIYTAAGSGTFGSVELNKKPVTGTPFSGAQSIAVAPDGTLYFSTSGKIYRVTRYDPVLQAAVAANTSVYSSQLVADRDGTSIHRFDKGRHVETLDSVTGATLWRFGYTVSGLLAWLEDGHGNRTLVERDGQGKPSAIVSPDGRRTVLSTDASGMLDSLTDPSGARHLFGYKPGGLLTDYTDPNGGVHKHIFDYLGLLLRDSGPIGNFWHLSEQVSGNRKEVTMTSAEGRTEKYMYEPVRSGDILRGVTGADGLTVSTLQSGVTSTSTAPDGTVTTSTAGSDPRFGMGAPIEAGRTVKTPSGLTSSVTNSRTVVLAVAGDPLSMTKQTDTAAVNGKNYTTVYDKAASTITGTTPAGRQSIATLDANGKVTKQKTTGLADVNYSYDARGRLTGISTSLAPDARTTTLTYDAQGNVSAVTDAMGGVIGYTYNASGRVTSKTLKDGRVVQFTYDANGNVTGITPPSRPSHLMGYNLGDLETSYSPPAVIGGGVTQYAYNLDKQLTLVTRPDGQTVSITYDAAGRESVVATPTGTITHSYSPTTGKLTSVASSSGETLSYAYDGFLPLSETWSGIINGTVGRTYNADFRVTSLNINGTAISLAYDNDGLLTAAGSESISRNAQNGLVTGTTLSGIATAYTYNTFGELASERHTGAGQTFFDVQYTRDKLGRITQRIETVGGVATTYGYVYDTAGRLIQVSKNGAVQSAYAYDSNGNRLGKTDAIGTTAGTYDAQDRLLTYGANSYSYSANGELQSKTNPQGTTSYRYDVLGNLTAATLPDGTLFEYVIDGANRRVGKRINGALAQGFLYANQLNPVAELDGVGNVVSTFIYGAKGNVPDYMVKGGITYRIISDHLGSPRVVVNTATNAVVQAVTYDEFGVVLSDSNPGFIPFGFGGGLYDNQIKFVRFGARDYDPETGRWTSKDPVGFLGGDTNLFGYVLGDPFNFIDPLGLARLGARPLGATSISAGPLYHSQFWYKDRTNSGFFPKNGRWWKDDGYVRQDDGHSENDYDFSKFPKEYDDELLKKAEEIVRRTKPSYSLSNYNCHDYAKEVDSVYDSLARKK